MRFVLLPLGFFLCAIYHSEIIFNEPTSLLLSSLFFIYFFIKNRPSFLSILPRLALITYSLPFIHGFFYLNFDYNSTFQNSLWGLSTTPYHYNQSIIQRVLMMGMIGLLGIGLGMLFCSKKSSSVNIKNSYEIYPRLNIWPFFIFSILSVLTTAAHSPQNTIFTTAYAQGGSGSALVSSYTLNAGWIISYAILILLQIDLLNETHKIVKKYKKVIYFISFALITIFFQLLRGKRDCLGLIIATAAIYLISIDIKSFSFKKGLTFLIAGLALFISLQFTGFIRGGVVGKDFKEALTINTKYTTDITNYFSGTWTAVFRTPLSIVGDHYLGYKKLKYGQTYLDYLLSLPPSFIASIFNYKRPVEATHGPSWEMTYGIGGTHISVVPYMNFGIWGVYIILFLTGFFLNWLELKPFTKSLPDMLLYGTILATQVFWFWYGELYLVRALMSYVFSFSLFYLTTIFQKASNNSSYNNKLVSNT